MVGYGWKLDYHDQPKSIKTEQDQERSNQCQLNKNQSLAQIALALFINATTLSCTTLWAKKCIFGGKFRISSPFHLLIKFVEI